MFKNILLAVLFLISVLFFTQSRAENAPHPPTKESLLTKWEQYQSSNPDTIKFSKTAQEKIYDYGTKTFPYNGKLKVANLYVDQEAGGYYDEDDETFHPAGTYTGVVEVELIDAPKELPAVYYRSFSSWRAGNTFIYDVSTTHWYSQAEWREKRRVDAAAKAKSASTCTGNPPKEGEWWSTPLNYFLNWFPMLLLVGVWIYFMRSFQKSGTKYKTLNDQYEIISELVVINKKILEELKRKNSV